MLRVTPTGFGTRVAFACYDGFLRVHDARTGEELPCTNPHQDELNAVAWSPDGQTLATAGGQWDKPQPIKLWDTASGKLLRQLKGHKAEIKALACAADGRLTSLSLDGTARIWDPRLKSPRYTSSFPRVPPCGPWS